MIMAMHLGISLPAHPRREEAAEGTPTDATINNSMNPIFISMVTAKVRTPNPSKQGDPTVVAITFMRRSYSRRTPGDNRGAGLVRVSPRDIDAYLAGWLANS
jgi:hypothetical protein